MYILIKNFPGIYMVWYLLSVIQLSADYIDQAIKQCSLEELSELYQTSPEAWLPQEYPNKLNFNLYLLCYMLLLLKTVLISSGTDRYRMTTDSTVELNPFTTLQVMGLKLAMIRP